ncbi:binding-protein-dependent transport systems inner membrane component [Thermaerobacter marianensis DSM 12885]|uniref:Binding-protein-dependent transport systems inner membrane component n=1 Tax=Thermaerobacter marianensis (strain ATCC 700841 / DSM 12885 / JCM 10246 / 7p75a) TaxID=644966 RepID=E6SIT4_THEM7|nr:nickel transporter permease [Thermaerobacter marianensis]ADU52028.1 binding-protein-dependent transport systems inner membrane component [Thermaerobacter marianensis DSM 12885]
MAAWRQLWKNPLTAAGLVLALLLLAAALLAPVLAPYPADAGDAVHPDQRLEPPSARHWLGTDDLGRDLLSRILFGARLSLRAGLLAISLAVLIGVPLGALAGYAGGWLDEGIMRVTDIFLSFPPLLLAIVFAAMLEPSVNSATLAIALSWWPWYTRLVRGEAVSLRERPFVEAARAAGVRPLAIIARHILPNAWVPVVVQASLDFGSVILTFAALSFLGLGAQPPQPEWGLMISTGRTFFLDHPWYVTFPGLAIFLTVLAFNLLGDGLREALDPKGVRRVL